jgi:hypothetical protein
MKSLSSLSPLAFLALFVFVILLIPPGRIYERLKEWQSGLGAAFGLVVAAMVSTWSAEQSLNMWKLQQDTESYQVANALVAEIEVMYEPLLDLAEITSNNKESVAVAAQSPANRYCMHLQRHSLAWVTVADLGLFDANKSNMGKIPSHVGVDFTRFHLDWRELRKIRDEIPKESCNSVTSKQFDRITTLAIGLLKRIERLKASVAKLSPGT